ncbi:MAG TPA: class I SAM-dependent methyltransferase [Candidatus Sulfotelmatobacter sp.]|nr:class I SAM-dependent methyltransferase [Candidatus Sulfotelmatobacter sp.]
MSYDPRAFWNHRLSEQFDLRGTGEPGLSLAYNRACYDLRRRVLTTALRDSGLDPRGRTVLDVGCGTGFFTAYYHARGGRVTGLDITPTSIQRLRERFPDARFIEADVSEASLGERYDIVNAFDVLYHITDDERWERAVTRLALAVAPQGLLLLTDTFSDSGKSAEHVRARGLPRYRAILQGQGLEPQAIYPTHVLLNRELGAFRFLNRLPALLWAADRVLLALGGGHGPTTSKLLVARRVR